MIRINLLPRERVARRPIASRVGVAIGIGAILALMIFYYVLLTAQNINLQNQIADSKKEIEQLRPQVAHVELLKKQLEVARRKEAVLKTLEASRVPWDTVLEEFRTIMPKDVWLNQMTAADDGGLVFDGFGISYEAIARLMVNMSSSKLFKDIDLAVAQKQTIATTEVVNFSVTGRLTQVRKEAGQP